MSELVRCPALVWEDRDGFFTAALALFGNQSAFGRTEKEATHHLTEYLEWIYEESPWMARPDFLLPGLFDFKVDIRPEYQVNEQTYPCAETIPLRVHFILGQEAGGLSVCSLPMLKKVFHYYDEAALRSLVLHFVRDHFRQHTPQMISRYALPANVKLHEIVARIRDRDTRPVKAWFERPEFENLAAVAEPITNQRGRGLQFGSAWGRGPEVQQLTERFRRGKTHILLVGEPGVGKTTLLADAARKCVQSATENEDEPKAHLRKYRFWLTNASRLIAGMKYLGQWQQRCESVIEELSACDGLLCAENLLDLVNIGGHGPADSVASFLLPYLQRGELRMVTEATPAELDACRRLLPGFADVFQIQPVNPFDPQSATEVLQEILQTAARNEHIEIDSGIAPMLCRFFRRFRPYEMLPGKAIKLVQRLIEHAIRNKAPKISITEAVEEFARDTGLPGLFLRDEILLNDEQVKGHFSARIIGQPRAVKAASNVVMKFKAGMNDPARPLGVFLFCGPTGVGKTAMAHALADYFFGHGQERDRLVRLDMSEYSLPGSAERLLRAPDGGPSDLIKRVRRQPFCVLLLDEIEKAAPEVFDVFLNVFDEGRLTDRLGRTTNFRSALIIMTSNLGAESGGGLGFGDQQGPAYESEVTAFFRPEFYNRIDAVVVFDPLEQATIVEITRKELAELAQREGFVRANLRLKFAEALVERLAREGFDRRFGARPLQRTIEREVVTPLAKFLLQHRAAQDCELCIDQDEGGTIRVAIADKPRNKAT